MVQRYSLGWGFHALIHPFSIVAITDTKTEMTTQKLSLFRVLSIGTLLTASVFVSPGFAQDNNAATEEQPSQSQTQYGDWTVMCQGEGLKDCRAMQMLNFSNESGTGRLMSLVIRKAVEGPLMVMEMPFGLDLRAGVVVRFDENDEIPLPFSVCLNNGCQVITLLVPEHAEQFRTANSMRVGFRAFGQSDTIVVEVSLKGSSAAMRALPEPEPISE